MAKTRGKLQAVHWRAEARALPAFKTEKRYVFSKEVNEGQSSVVAKCGSFVYNLQIQSKNNQKSTAF